MDVSEAARLMVGSCGKAILNPIMMRFRPIAPKPVAGGSLSGGASSVESKNSSISNGRTKRKYVRVRRYNRKKKITTRNTSGSSDDGNKNAELVDQAAVTTTTMMTLQLLPERDHVKVVGGGSERWENEREVVGRRREREGVLVSDPKRGAVELWVTVECVKEACMDLEVEEAEIGCTDEERIKNLEEDTCPGFVSDGMNRVEWLNKAFKRMVRQRERKRSGAGAGAGGGSGSGSGSGSEIGVWLISKPKLPNLRRVFTCQIKLQFKRDAEMDKDSKLVPCDAWRMDGGGFAWKLDVKAALTLAPLLQEDFD